MKQILVDTSVWIDYFNGKNSQANILSQLIDTNAICTNDLILAELVPFLRHAGEHKLTELLFKISRHEIKIDWQRIIDYQTLNLKKGINKVGIPDLILIQHALDLHLTLLTFDKHFELMAKHHHFELYEF